jgi:hypothetical protein
MNKWFLLTVLLLVGLGSFSFVAYKRTRALCHTAQSCGPQKAAAGGDLLLDVFSGQFSSVSIP